MNSTAMIPKLSVSPFAAIQPAVQVCLGADDLAVLKANEAVIERGNKTFVEVGRALLTIRDHENGVLYKQRYGTFESYWRERWGFEHAHVYRLMDAAKIYDELAPLGVVSPSAPLPTTERQIRALKGLPSPELRLNPIPDSNGRRGESRAYDRQGGGTPATQGRSEASARILPGDGERPCNDPRWRRAPARGIGKDPRGGCSSADSR